MAVPGALVANHSSWLDIFVLNAAEPVYFVSKAEVAGWPGIGWLARATGTLFIRRDPREAAVQVASSRSGWPTGTGWSFSRKAPRPTAAGAAVPHSRCSGPSSRRACRPI